MVKGDQFYRPKDIQRLEKWIILPWKCHANAGIHSDSLDLGCQYEVIIWDW